MLFKRLLLVLTLITIGSYLAYAASTSSCYDLDDTSLMMHMDGADSAQIFTDETGKTVSVTGSVQTDTATPKFGSAAAEDFVASEYLSLADSAAWAMGTSDFTIELWMMFPQALNVGGSNYLLCQADSDHQLIFAFNPSSSTAGLLYFAIYIKPNDYLYNTFPTSINVTVGVWTHVAIVRSGTSFMMFHDGILIKTVTLSAAMPDGTGILKIGEYLNNGYPMTGQIDELRITKGVAIWTGNFTPPAAPYTDCDAPVGGAGRRRISICSGD